MQTAMKMGLTFDVDWAKDEVVIPIIETLVNRKIKATWFITHQGDYLDKLREHTDLFELGIHPNFYSGSTQGNSFKEIMDNLMKMVPEARCIRTHGLNTSSEIVNLIFDYTELTIDSSILTLGAPQTFSYKLYRNNQMLQRIPINWEDDIFMGYPESERNYAILDGYKNKAVFNFHPIHIHLNSKNWEGYLKYKTGRTIHHEGIGIKELFLNLVNEKNLEFVTLPELCS